MFKANKAIASVLALIMVSVFALFFCQKSVDATSGTLANKLKGKILIQVESRGEAWYVNPKDGKRYYMADGNQAFQIMKTLGVGISNKDLNKIKSDANYRKKFIGKILLQVESRGEAYYISSNNRYNYLKDGTAAYNIMKSLGTGITNKDLEAVPVSQSSKGNGLSTSTKNTNSIATSSAEKLILFGKNIVKECSPMDIIESDESGSSPLIKISTEGLADNKCNVKFLILNEEGQGESAICPFDLASDEEYAAMTNQDFYNVSSLILLRPGLEVLDIINRGLDKSSASCHGDLIDAMFAEMAK